MLDVPHTQQVIPGGDGAEEDGQPSPGAAGGAAGGGSSSAATKANSQSSPILSGLEICITGGIANPQFANRDAVGAYINSLGGTFTNNMKKGTDWLVVSVSTVAWGR